MDLLLMIMTKKKRFLENIKQKKENVQATMDTENMEEVKEMTN